MLTIIYLLIWIGYCSEKTHNHWCYTYIRLLCRHPMPLGPRWYDIEYFEYIANAEVLVLLCHIGGSCSSPSDCLPGHLQLLLRLTLRQKTPYPCQITDTVTTLFANLIDMTLKGETSIKHNSKIANCFHRREFIFKFITWKLSWQQFTLLNRAKQ